jgi:hypothetical protein
MIPTINNLPPSVSSKSLEIRKAFLKSYEDSLSRGLSNEDALFNANQSSKLKEKLISVSKAKEYTKANEYIKPKVPQHLSAVLNKQKELSTPAVYKAATSSEVFDKLLLGKGALTPDSSRSLVSAKWDKQGRLELNFDDGNKLLTDPVPMIGKLEQHLYIPNSSNSDGDNEDMLSKRIDFISDNVLYKAEAPVGVANSAPLWRIRLITISTGGDTVETWANGNSNFDKVWDNRLSYTYS